MLFHLLCEIFYKINEIKINEMPSALRSQSDLSDLSDTYYDIDNRNLDLNSKQGRKSNLKRKLRELDWDTRKHKPYGQTKKDILFGIYLSAIILWGILLAYLSPNVDLWGWIILLIPILVFLISMFSLDGVSTIVEENVFQINTLSVGLLIILPLLAFITKDFKGDQILMVQVVLLAITFSLLSMIDVWVSEKWITLTRHVRSIFQTVSLTLILFALYLYYSTMGTIPSTSY